MIREGCPAGSVRGLRAQRDGAQGPEQSEIGPVDNPRAGSAAGIVGTVDDDLATLAAAQGGAFTRAQALAAGFSPAQIRTRLRRDWTAMERGVYVTAEQLAAVRGNRVARHLLQASARLLTSALGVAASHRTGALVHEFALLGRPPQRPQLTRAPRFPGDSSATPSLYVASLAPEDVATRNGLAVTAPARTVCDVARTTVLRSGVVTADSALRAGLDEAALAAAVRACADWPGGRRAAQVAAFADGRADTALESITRFAYDVEGLPPPETQVEIRDPYGRIVGIVDFLWRAQRTVGEADGMLKYDQPQALRFEKLREEHLRACGLEVVRNTWDDAWYPASRRELARRVRQAFGFAAQRPIVEGVGLRTPSLAELTARRRALPDRLAS